MHIENINNAFIELNNLNYQNYLLHFAFLFLKVTENIFEFNIENNRLINQKIEEIKRKSKREFKEILIGYLYG